MGELDGRRALVTGAAEGLGRAVAEVFVELGARVMLSDVQDDLVAKEAAGLGAASVHCDVTVAADVEAAVAATVDAFGGIDIVVNNAGIENIAALVDLKEEDLDRILAVNVKGVYFGIKYGAPAIIASGGGAIVNMASVMGLGGCPLLGAYCATKAAVISLTQTAAVELRDHGVRVNAVCPTFAPTAMVARGAPILEAALGQPLEPILAQVQGRLVTTREVADAVAFLASNRSSFVNGIAFPVDNAMSSRLL
ncbi:MAG TPA: SDR family NAD(P)-dependent oxidoreductase [Acidimicrobiia bacterium]|nr:SDR family NAD(P)-dependent oxidoreductase [Acidimicrobiia bacterium]